ncbi:hypothetical protein F5Y18DRAFT_251704 [Xylariaceae sp. FL1019]|nr:hypothetical protein F5Y18DRAFT_251704 [Xylariaceae sp. FL1019]
MKYSAIATLLSFVSAATFNTRQSTGLRYEISDFDAECESDKTTCEYELKIIISDDPEREVNCDFAATSENGELPAISESQCGRYRVAIDKTNDGGLAVTVKGDQGTGTYQIPSGDIDLDSSGDRSVQKYDGDSDFTIELTAGSSSTSSTTTTSAATTVTTAATTSEASSSIPTTSSEPSSSPTTSSESITPSPTNGAAHGNAFAGLPLAVGLMALAL